MKLATANQMNEIDRQAMDSMGMPGTVLMENAAISVFNEALKFIENHPVRKAAVFCGTGNNGGDGFGVARHMLQAGIDVRIVLLGSADKIKGDAQIQYNMARLLNIPIIEADEKNLAQISRLAKTSQIIIDALFGTGFRGRPKGVAEQLIQCMNASETFTLAVDMPSGINADTGKAEGVAVSAHKTVTFGLPKIGHMLFPGCLHTGEIELYPISIPPSILQNFSASCHFLTDVEAAGVLPPRSPYSHKGTYGRATIIAGSDNMPGAAVIAASAAYRSGCGLVELAIPESIGGIVQPNLPEAIVSLLPQKQGKLWNGSLELLNASMGKASVLAIGPGLGQGSETASFIQELVRTANKPLIIDADALNGISENPDILKQAKQPVVITPHILEFSRLSGLSKGVILKDILKAARDFSAKYDVITVLKDARTVIAHPSGETYINVTGHHALAKGGSGDILTGIIAGLAASGLHLYKSAILGSYILGKAGELAAEKHTGYSTTAMLTMLEIPQVFKALDAMAD